MVTAAIMHCVVKYRHPVIIKCHPPGNSVQLAAKNVQPSCYRPGGKPDCVIQLQQYVCMNPGIGNIIKNDRSAGIYFQVAAVSPGGDTKMIGILYCLYFPGGGAYRSNNACMVLSSNRGIASGLLFLAVLNAPATSSVEEIVPVAG